MKKTKQYLKRLKNPATIIGIASYILIMLSEFDIQIDNERVMIVVKCLAGIFILLGILNNPETSGIDIPAKTIEKS